MHGVNQLIMLDDCVGYILEFGMPLTGPPVAECWFTQVYVTLGVKIVTALL